jgi:Fe-S oxidoreductase
MEKILGIHRDRHLPLYASETFNHWFDRQTNKGKSKEGKKVALFYTCSVNYNQPDIGKACVDVLEKNGIQVVCPKQQCCGMPYIDGGDIEATKKSARANVETLHALVKENCDVVVPGPTCSYMLKREYPMLLEGREVQEVAGRTYDICEYLMALHAEGKLDTRFAKEMGRVAYQMPCHLRAQNIGFKSRDLMQLIPGTTVHTIEKCSAIDGTWGLKQQYFNLSLKVAEPLLREIHESQPDLTVSDCSLAALQIEQGIGKRALHPVQVLAMAYGLERGTGDEKDKSS